MSINSSSPSSTSIARTSIRNSSLSLSSLYLAMLSGRKTMQAFTSSSVACTLSSEVTATKHTSSTTFLYVTVPYVLQTPIFNFEFATTKFQTPNERQNTHCTGTDQIMAKYEPHRVLQRLEAALTHRVGRRIGARAGDGAISQLCARDNRPPQSTASPTSSDRCLTPQDRDNDGNIVGRLSKTGLIRV
ncbi:uncharacterized protein RAG0_05711 [Rhynchosporium agropyri]|uniref:Uncharacterized protein n=1 Tax=Rhynchosporium agropyri TaxID=914238 RepID=A0A1E1KE55_9HELO|nr:uncharacterized protein RAG0_05711 [Rhynchosporium agropyri]